MLIGVDLVEIKRIAELAGKSNFLARIYTDEELRLVENVSEQRKFEILAGRFAVKEAGAKALGTGISGGITFHDFETTRGANGEPVLKISGKAKQVADSLGVYAARVSLSHAENLAIAFVLFEV